MQTSQWAATLDLVQALVVIIRMLRSTDLHSTRKH